MTVLSNPPKWLNTEFCYIDLYLTLLFLQFWLLPFILANSCCRPPVPPHATLYSNGHHGFGDNAYIKCEKGYIRGGTDFRECMTNGKWSGDDTSCTGKEFFLLNFA